MDINLPAFQRFQLALLDPVEPVVAERADERVFGDALVQLQTLETAYAAAEARGAPRTRRAGAPGDEQRAARSGQMGGRRLESNGDGWADVLFVVRELGWDGAGTAGERAVEGVEGMVAVLRDTGVWVEHCRGCCRHGVD